MQVEDRNSRGAKLRVGLFGQPPDLHQSSTDKKIKFTEIAIPRASSSYVPRLRSITPRSGHGLLLIEGACESPGADTGVYAVCYRRPH